MSRKRQSGGEGNRSTLAPTGPEIPSNDMRTGHVAEGSDHSEVGQLFLATDVDMFGVPTRPPRGRGRPPHVPTTALRKQVIALRAQGLNLIETAAAIGITHPTLLVHYHAELKSKSEARRRQTQGRTNT